MHLAKEAALVPLGEGVGLGLLEVEEARAHREEGEALAKHQEVVLAYLGEALVNQEQGGFEHFFSCLCADPCGSPLNGWMRIES